MKVDQKILSRLNELIDFGNKVLSTKRSAPRGVIGDSRVDTQLANQWMTSVQNLLIRVFGPDSEYYKGFVKQVEKHPTYSPIYRAYGVLLAAKDDYEHEGLFEIRKLVEAEMFDDFLEQAEHLLSSGYFQPAAVLAGAVLEDALRKLCKRQNIDLDERPKLDRMNAELGKVGAYNKFAQKRITALADLRNSAAHGKWEIGRAHV